MMAGDTITLEAERPEGEPLLRKVMEKGRRLGQPADLAAISRTVAEQLRTLPENLRRLESDPPYEVRISPALIRLREETRSLYE